MSWEFVLPNLIAGDTPHVPGLVADLPAETLMDSDAFAGFYQRSARPLWAYLARVSTDPALADDLMQESFVRFLCASRPELSLAEGEVAARRYLFRIASNLLRDHWRRPVSASIEELPEEFFAAADRSAQADSQAILGPALAQMRPRDRQILWLAHAEGYSHREIAQITGLASASIRLLLFRARRRIARILMAQGELRAAAKEGQPQQAAGLRSQP
ncbi:MAG TPA: sigma-70 family RNA polymerase sigma factor [Terracidiphilus sp.]|nr:sigma-70 family RNA polymerase sigma factor [Terracidiphilus sp.]